MFLWVFGHSIAKIEYIEGQFCACLFSSILLGSNACLDYLKE